MKFVVLVNGSCGHYSTADRETHSNDRRSPWPRRPLTSRCTQFEQMFQVGVWEMIWELINIFVIILIYVI